MKKRSKKKLCDEENLLAKRTKRKGEQRDLAKSVKKKKGKKNLCVEENLVAMRTKRKGE